MDKGRIIGCGGIAPSNLLKGIGLCNTHFGDDVHKLFRKQKKKTPELFLFYMEHPRSQNRRPTVREVVEQNDVTYEGVLRWILATPVAQMSKRRILVIPRDVLISREEPQGLCVLKRVVPGFSDRLISLMSHCLDIDMPWPSGYTTLMARKL